MQMSSRSDSIPFRTHGCPERNHRGGWSSTRNKEAHPLLEEELSHILTSEVGREERSMGLLKYPTPWIPLSLSGKTELGRIGEAVEYVMWHIGKRSM